MLFQAQLCSSMLAQAVPSSICWHMLFPAQLCCSKLNRALPCWYMLFQAQLCSSMLAHAVPSSIVLFHAGTCCSKLNCAILRLVHAVRCCANDIRCSLNIHVYTFILSQADSLRFQDLHRVEFDMIFRFVNHNCRTCLNEKISFKEEPAQKWNTRVGR